MKATGVSTDSQGSTSSVEGESASLHDEIQGFGQSGSTNGGSPSVGKANASLYGGEMQASSQNGSTNGGSSSVGKASAPLHEEIQTSGYGGSTSESSSSVKCKLPYTNKRTFCFHADRDGSSPIGGYTGTSPSKTTN
ncbi:hypothetical protein ACTHQ0_09030 [Priestia megaterium]|uniref:hypothetical protein n=1 Tax=Priestia megaterium TaxID=1404 RepID=UPI000A79EBE9|nr:hypothetical protein [Priestia megaterium]MBY0201305.1 hypothetical protein [Priestia megaterium]